MIAKKEERKMDRRKRVVKRKEGRKGRKEKERKDREKKEDSQSGIFLNEMDCSFCCTTYFKIAK